MSNAQEDVEALIKMRLLPYAEMLNVQLRHITLSGSTPEAKEDYVLRNMEIRTRIHTLEHAVNLLLNVQPDGQASQQSN